MINKNVLRKTKIVATIGPACEDTETLKSLLRAGVDCARFNFSHGDHAEQKRRMDSLKKACLETKRRAAIMLDTKGPEIRIKQFAEGSVSIKEGSEFTLSCTECVGNSECVSVTYPLLYNEVKKGTVILIDDGLMALCVTEIRGTDIVTKALNTGKLSNNKSINIPSVHIMLPSLTEKDIDDITFGVENDIDYIAASFIRCAADVVKIRQLLKKLKAEHIKIIAKIENREGVNNAEEIIAFSDGIMVGRGDLGVEIPAEEVPSAQKRLIRLCNHFGKPVITATQMLESMTHAPRPTRAEVGDVANAVYDGSDCVMLSGETAAGDYPVEAVQTMARIVVSAEGSLEENANYKKDFRGDADITNTIAYAASSAAEALQARVIVTPTSSGNTARALAKYRPQAELLAVTNKEYVARQLCLVWGTAPLYIKEWRSLNEGVKHCLQFALKNSLVSEDDTVVVTAGLPMGKSGSTNTIKIDEVRDYYEG